MKAAGDSRTNAASGSRATVDRQPALDGVRALAVAVVMLFHAGSMSGGYLGVSVFFTLSGYLITALLLAEYQHTGAVDVARFYTRRAKRLLPAGLFWLAVVTALAAGDAFSGVISLRRDVVAAAMQVFNWVKLGSGESYAELNAAAAGVRRPLDHYWSLSVEQQFYWIWPLIFLGLARRRVLSIGVTILAAISCIAAPVIAHVWGPDAAYWATPARLAEILIGAVTAIALAGRTVRRGWWLLTPLGLAALAIACALFPDGSGPAYQGWLPLVALASSAVIVGLQPSAMPRRALSWRPLVALGRASYSVYIIHWPVYVLVDRQQWDLPTVVDLAIKFAITGALAAASYRLIEMPMRTSRWLTPRRTVVAGGLATAMAAVMALLVPQIGAYYRIDAAAAAAAAIEPSGSVVPLTTAARVPEVTTAGDSAPTTDLRVERPVRILVVGDSTATAIGAGLVNWAAGRPDLAQVSVEAGSGCGLLPVGIVRIFDEYLDLGTDCAPYLNEVVPGAVTALRPDVVVIIETAWDIEDRQLVEGGPVLSPLDPEIATMMSSAYDTFTAGLLALGVPRVAWLVPPMALPTEGAVDQMVDRPGRYAVQHAVLEQVARTREGVRLIDLRSWMDQRGLLDGYEQRPDGTHFTTAVATLTAEEFLGPAIVKSVLS